MGIIQLKKVVQNVLFNDEEQVGLGQGIVTDNFNKTSVCNNCFNPLFGNTVTSENRKVVKFRKLWRIHTESSPAMKADKVGLRLNGEGVSLN